MKELEKVKLQKLPTTELIFYMTDSKLSDESLKSKIEVVLYARLTKKYKLYPDMARKFVEREKKIIESRDADIESYLLGMDVPLEEILKNFYDNIDTIGRAAMIEENFNNLTMSELVQFKGIFVTFESLYRYRKKLLNKELEKNIDKQKGLLNNNNISFETKEQKINELKNRYEIIQLQKTKESSLVGYNNFLSKCMSTKFRFIMGYDKKDVLTLTLTIMKEGFLQVNKSSIQKNQLKEYRNIDFDAYEHDTSLISQYDVQGYPFSKKRF